MIFLPRNQKVELNTSIFDESLSLSRKYEAVGIFLFVRVEVNRLLSLAAINSDCSKEMLRTAFKPPYRIITGSVLLTHVGARGEVTFFVLYHLLQLVQKDLCMLPTLDE